MTHIEEARKLEPVAFIVPEALQELEKHSAASATVWSGRATHRFVKDACPLVRLSDAQAALAAAEERGRSEERERCAKAYDVLAGLSSFLGAGLGDESTTAEQYDKRIRLGIDELQSSIIRLCMEKVERCSERPSTTWGEVKASLASILPPAITKEPTP